MLRSSLLLLALLLSPSVVAQPTPAATASQSTPSTTARQALDAWLAAFNSHDRAQLEAFARQYRHEMDVPDVLNFSQEVGGFVLIKQEPAADGVASALLREGDSERYARVQVTAAAGKPLQVDLRGVPTPEELRPARLDTAAAITALAARADAVAAQDKFSGVLLVAQGDEVLLQRAWGQADRAAHQANTLETKFRLGSMNKMITSVATLQLVQAGKLSLDGTVGDYLKDYPNADVRKVTLRQLLSHRGGTGDIFGQEYERERLNLRTHADYLKLYGQRGLTHVPGAERRYSNYGFVLLGAIIEAVSGQSYYDYVDQHIYAPAGMRNSGSLPEDETVAGRARAYQRENGQWVDAADTLPWRGTSAGGGYSTAGDLLRFARALQAGTLVDPKLLAQATQPAEGRYGYGFAAGKFENAAWYGHGGGAPGMNADFRVFPSLDRVVIALSNFDPEAAERMMDYYLARMPITAH
ncbi:MAG TPA: serine hydrolase domain-containing protein [Pseudoxanthomonas sp.]|nr:serine hydrolase domain-containing protein [Pseudoxanthomonas sp.]